MLWCRNTSRRSALAASSWRSLLVVQAEKLNSSGMEVTYRLPLSSSPAFPALLGELDKSKDPLGVANYGLSVTTLEEVFLKVATHGDVTHEEREHTKSMVRSLSQRRSSGGGSKDTDKLFEASQHAVWMSADVLQASVEHKYFGRHFRALMAKRFNVFKRDKRAGCCQVCPVVALLCSCIHLSSWFR